jgi:D-alanyl-D-alanine dipeptidase
VSWDRTKGHPEPIRRLNQVKELENGEPLVDLREFCPRVRLIRPTVIPYLRKTVAEMLNQASKALPDGYFFSAVDGWRPLARQQRIYDFMWQSAKEAFPDRSFASLRRTVCRWVAPTDQPAPPGHCTGAAVDLWLVDEAGENIDVTSPYHRWGAAPTYMLGLTPEAQRNRKILLETLLGVGFSNCRDEWWHYSYGDAGWAVRTEQKTCCYGLIHLPEEIYALQEEESKEGMKDRPNPFLPGN